VKDFPSFAADGADCRDRLLLAQAGLPTDCGVPVKVLVCDDAMVRRKTNWRLRLTTLKERLPWTLTYL
jgi:hypothetical protein